MASKILVESFYNQSIQSAMDTSSTEVTVDVAPTNDIDYAVLENGESNQEMIKWQAKVGLVLSSLLRGLSLTALTDTEVAGNKKTHLVNSSIQITDVHYLLNDKVSNAAEETIVGLKTFTLAPKASAAATQTTELMRWDETCRLSDDQTVAGIKTFTSIPVLPASDPTADNQAARKKYIDDLIAALSVPNIIDEHGTYTPAYLTGGASAESNVAIWDSVSDGAFQATIDGVARSFTGMDFTATGPLGIVTDMDEVAAVIQYYIRALTASTETCVWSTDHFVITSADTTVATEVSVLTAGASGTDISGAGAGAYMDADSGHGVATAGVLDPTADVGKLMKLLATGLMSSDFLPTNLQEIADTGSTDITATELETLSDGSDASALHGHGLTCQAGSGNTTSLAVGGTESVNIDIDVTPFDSGDTVQYTAYVYASVYANQNPGATSTVYGTATWTGLVGGESSGRRDSITSAGVITASIPTSPAPESLASVSIAGPNSGTVSVAVPVWSGNNLRFVATISGAETGAGFVTGTAYVAVTATKLG